MPQFIGEESSAGEVIKSMIEEAVGADNPMSEEALAVAGIEVVARIQAAQAWVHNTHPDIGAMDTKAMYAALQLEIENRNI